MPPFMPYTTEKSPVFQVAESWANADRSVALEAMWKLLDGEPASEMAPIWSTNLNYPPYLTPQARIDHVEREWFGKTPDGGGGWTPQSSYHPYNHPNTGFWQHWHGDAEGIFRTTMIRALCVSLGLPVEDPKDTQKYKGKARPKKLQGGTQHWPISILWKCPQPWYEGWIEWKKWEPGARGGHVTVVLSTPSHGVKLFDSPERPPNSPRVITDPFGAYAVDPKQATGKEGLWVISQKVNAQIPPPTNAPSPPNTWAPPVLGIPVVSLGPIVCVSPAVGDGGVAPGGIPYTP